MIGNIMFIFGGKYKDLGGFFPIFHVTRDEDSVKQFNNAFSSDPRKHAKAREGHAQSV